MSDSELSDLPSDHESYSQMINLYRRELLDTRPPTVKMIFLQPGCGYSLPPQGLKQSSTGNLWRHYSLKHPTAHSLKHPTVSYALKNENRQSSSASSSTSSFFNPRPSDLLKQPGNPSKYKELLLQFIVSNNLSIRLVESYSFRELVQFLSPTTIAISARTLHRELQRQFSYHRGQLQLELYSHIKKGGRVLITTDAWSARNYTDYAAVTVHWIVDKWQQKSKVLDVVHLKEPIHSGEYLAQQLAIVTDDMGITGAVFTCTRDNASANTIMLAEYEKIARDQEVTTQQPWTFRVKEGDLFSASPMQIYAALNLSSVLEVFPHHLHTTLQILQVGNWGCCSAQSGEGGELPTNIPRSAILPWYRAAAKQYEITFHKPLFFGMLPVAIIGGGPVGLVSSILLSQQEIPHVLFERHPSTYIHPKACGMNQRSMEIFRQMGIEAEILEHRAPPDTVSRTDWYTSLGPNGREIIGRDAWGGGKYQGEYNRASPSPYVLLPQIRLEAILQKKALQLNCAGIHYGVHVTAVEEQADWVILTLMPNNGSGGGSKSKQVMSLKLTEGEA
ncbi:hypothetical protein V500_03062 [Pseudogymnoascus sp. VKM F-4518 (FW-2643)]|nr:hypothetical protein V500_03062 [Pseudogymnoascus sp. VKM F-4518 (FW-2643)]